MVSIEKSPNVPHVLATRGIDGIKNLCEAYDQNPEAYHSAPGKDEKDIQKFEIKSSIYGHETVKQQLIDDQFKKCCYCESLFLENGYGDVEHYRPKAAYKALNATKLTYPGYYWLAYDWQNLIFSCQICNQQFKKNHFPLIDESKRVHNHHSASSLSQEEPLMLHPVQENPEEHLTFVNEVAVPKNGNIRGQFAIKVFGLDRAELANARERRLEEVDSALALADVDLGDRKEVDLMCRAIKVSVERLRILVARAQRVKREAALSSAPYAAMIRANFPELR